MHTIEKAVVSEENNSFSKSLAACGL